MHANSKQTTEFTACLHGLLFSPEDGAEVYGRFGETSLKFYYTTGSHIPEDNTLISALYWLNKSICIFN
jgi:hypothetical protein